MSDPDFRALTGPDHDVETWIEAFEAMRSKTIAGALDVELVDVDDASIELAMPITDSARQPFGLLHGGVSMVLAESAASMHACWGIDLSEKIPVGIEINGSHLASAREGEVVAVGEVVKRGERTIVHEVEITHEGSRPLCRARATNLYVDPETVA